MKCFWCAKPLEFASCHIDHVIPVSSTKIVLKSLVKDYDLNANFSTSDCENLVPACGECVKNRGGKPFRAAQVLPGFLKLMRVNLPLVEGKVRLIEGAPSTEGLLKQLMERIERGEISPEFVQDVVEPFLESVEGGAKSSLEFRLSESVRMFRSQESWRLIPISELRYEKMVDGLIESSEWKKPAPEQIREGPSFGEGRRRKHPSG